MKTGEDRCRELIDKVLRRSKVIMDGLRRVAASPDRDKLMDMEGKLNEYNECVLEPPFSPLS